jgi:hypothetical protein
MNADICRVGRKHLSWKVGEEMIGEQRLLLNAGGTRSLPTSL